MVEVRSLHLRIGTGQWKERRIECRRWVTRFGCIFLANRWWFANIPFRETSSMKQSHLFLAVFAVVFAGCDSSSSTNALAEDNPPVVDKPKVVYPPQTGHDAAFIDSKAWKTSVDTVLPEKDTLWLRIPIQKDSGFHLIVSRYWSSDKFALQARLFEGNDPSVRSMDFLSEGTEGRVMLYAKPSDTGWMRLALVRRGNAQQNRIAIEIFPDDPYENDDSLRDAKILNPDGEYQSRNLGYDLDWMKIPTMKGKGYSLDFRSSATNLNYVIHLMAGSQESSQSTRLNRYFAATGDTAWIAVVQWGMESPRNGNNYKIRANLIPGAVDGDNMTKDAAASLNLGDTVKGGVNKAVSHWYKISVEAGATYSASISRGTDEGDGCVAAGFYGSDTTVYSDANTCSGSTGTRIYPWFKATTTGDVFLKVVVLFGDDLWADYKLTVEKR